MVSVIIPVYNTEKYIKKCIESITCQTYRNLEIIIIDDGSTDKSLQIINNYIIEDQRIRLIKQNNCGVSAARNKGLEVASGEYILFIDSDDWIESDMIEILVSNIVKGNSDISCCQYDRSFSREILDFESWTSKKASKMFLVHKKLNGSLVNKLIKTNVIKNIRFNTAIKYGEDALFFWHILKNINSLVITNKVLYHVTLHEDSASGGGSYKPIRKDCILVWKEIVEDAKNIDLEYEKLARAQLANMAFFSLYEMAYYHYVNYVDEQAFKDALKGNISFLFMSSFVQWKEKVLALVMLLNMSMASKIVTIYRRLANGKNINN